MKIVALTGSIGMGKSTTAAMFADLGVPVWDADQAVHRLYEAGGAACAPLAKLVPDAVGTQGVDRAQLAAQIMANPALLKAIEAIVHPLVGQDRAAFLAKARADHAPLVLVDVPLLFETGGEAYVDAVIVVTCPEEVQKARVLARPGMTEEKFSAFLARQTPDAEKRARADYLIDTSLGLDAAREQVGKVYAALTEDQTDGTVN